MRYACPDGWTSTTIDPWQVITADNGIQKSPLGEGLGRVSHCWWASVHRDRALCTLHCPTGRAHKDHILFSVPRFSPACRLDRVDTHWFRLLLSRKIFLKTHLENTYKLQSYRILNTLYGEQQRIQPGETLCMG